MDRHRYRMLLEDLCDHAGLARREQFLSDGLLRIHGADVHLRHDEDFDAGHLQARIDFGPAPEQRRQDIWRGLLATNFEWGQGGYLVFSLIPDDEHVVLSIRHALTDDLNGSELAAWLGFAVREGQSHWSRIVQAPGMPSPLPLHWETSV